MRLLLISNYKEAKKTQEARSNLTRCTGRPVEMLDYRIPDIYQRVLDTDPDLVFLSGSHSLLTRPETREEFQQEMEMVTRATFPVLGICFGHQLIGSAFGAGMTDLGRMHRGFGKVNVLNRHPLFEGLPTNIEVAESHRQVLNTVPTGFQRLAESTISKVEAICHENKLIYGLQFHPERADDAHPHGRILIQNLLKLVRNY